MGEKFSWDKLLKRKKKADNTIEVNPGESPMPPVAPLMSTESITHQPVQKQVNGPDIDLTVQGGGSSIPPQNKAPLVIDWDAYRAQSDDVSSPVESVSAPGLVENFGGQFPSAPPVVPVDSAPSVFEAPVAPVESVVEAGSAVPASGGWSDVELTPAEMAAMQFQKPTVSGSGEPVAPVTFESATEQVPPPVPPTIDFFAPVPPAVEEVVEPIQVPSWPEDNVSEVMEASTTWNVEPVSPQGTDVPQAPSETFQWSSPVAPETVAPPQAPEVAAWEPVAEMPNAVEAPVSLWDATGQSPEAPTADETPHFVASVEEPAPQETVVAETPSAGIPDIFAKAMGLAPQEPVVAPEAPVEAPQAVWMPEAATLNPPVVAEASVGVPTSTDEPVTQFPEVSAEEDDPNAVPETYRKADEDLEIQRGRDKRLGDLLLENRLITQRQLDRALERQAETKEKLGVILVAMQTMSERRLIQVLAAQKGVSPWHLEEDLPSEDALKLVPEDMCRVFQVLPVAVRGDLLLLAMRDPNDAEAIENIRATTKMRVEPVLADEARLAYTIDNAYGISKARRAVAIDKYVAEAMAGYEEFRRQNPDIPNPSREEDTRPVVGLVNHIIEEAIRMQASDIHFEPREEKAEIRYRLDGQLMKMRDFPAELLPLVNARIKIMADLDLSDQKNPQDGRTEYKYGSNVVGLRVSVLPNIHGDRVVMRVLDKTVGLRAMDKLGFEDQNLQMFRELIAKPYGLFLVTGPTGSGKTTTLYAALDELKESATNIMTCEDPVEYDLGGINQAEVNERSGLTFGKQLKAILRQDPDVVLIGEIRDSETADIAIRAATSGHMVLATLHCNDAAAAVPRLIDLGVDAHTLSAALTGTLSQRLIRVLCPSCKVQEAPTEEEQNTLTKYFGLEAVEKVWHAPGCPDCMNTGFKGRTAVHEVLPVTDEISSLIESGAKTEAIKTEAAYYGYLPMQQDAIARVLSGQTTVDEARRVLMFNTIEKRSAPRKIEVPKAS